jgi:hypothetical protein
VPATARCRRYLSLGDGAGALPLEVDRGGAEAQRCALPPERTATEAEGGGLALPYHEDEDEVEDVLFASVRPDLEAAQGSQEQESIQALHRFRESLGVQHVTLG